MSFKMVKNIDLKFAQKLDGIFVERHLDVFENEDAVSH
jgi:hypothetical protein